MSYYKYDFKELNNLPMLDVVEELGHTVKTSGRNKVMLCPFHQDHHPSMTIYEHSVKCFACGKHFGVIDFVRESEKMDLMEACNWLAEKFNVGRTWVETSNRPATKAPSKKRQNIIDLQSIIDKSVRSLPRKALPPSTGGTGVCPSFVFDLDYVAEHTSVENSFCKCLRMVFDAELVRYVTEMYGIGCWAVDDTMFPIIDKDLRVHNIKIQHYDTNPLSEHFFHKDKGAAWWYAKKYTERHPDKADAHHDVNCYFGEHLISCHPSSTIVLVESPKNAVLGACVWPQFVWVAAGNKGMLNRDRLECMRGRKVIVMPDCDAVEEWHEKLSTMQDIATFVISDMVEEFRKIGEQQSAAISSTEGSQSAGCEHKPKKITTDVGDWIIAKHFVLREVKS